MLLDDLATALRVEIAFGADLTAAPSTWAWTNVTGDLVRQSVSLNRGRQDEMSHVQASQLGFVLDNPNGQYTPEFPGSPHYPNVRLGAPIRVRVLAGLGGLQSSGQPSVSYADTPGITVTSDLDVRVDFTPAGAPPDAYLLTSKYLTGGDQRSWALQVLADGKVRLTWSTLGTFASNLSATSTVGVAGWTTRRAVRATLALNNGAGGRTITFYTAPTMAGPWTLLGAPVVQAGVTSIYPSTANLNVAAGPSGVGIFNPGQPLNGVLHAMQLRNGIDGTLIASPDFTTLDVTVTSFADSTGRPWTLRGASPYLNDPGVRFVGNLSDLRPEWPHGDLADEHQPGESRVNVVASGIIRRLEQGAYALRSSLYRDLVNKRNVVAYWPCEDDKGAKTFGSTEPGRQPMRITGQVDPAEYSGFVASGPLPAYKTSGRARGVVPRYTGAVDQRVIALVHVPEGGVTGGPDTDGLCHPRLLTVHCTGRFVQFIVLLTKSGGIRLGTTMRPLTDTGPTWYDEPNVTHNLGGLNGKHFLLSLWLNQGADNRTNLQVSAFEVGANTGTVWETWMRPASPPYGWDRIDVIQVGSYMTTGLNGSTTVDLNGTVVGHVAVINDDVHGAYWSIVQQSLKGWSGENAGERLKRLCTEEGIPLRMLGNTADTTPAGPQRLASVMEVLRDAADADSGLLYEDRTRSGLVYRTRANLYNQHPRLALDAANGFGEIVNPFAPVQDDSDAHNDVTVRRDGGASARAEDEGDIAARGRYVEETTVNVHDDDQLPHIAAWRLRRGTEPGMRYPSLSPAMAANDTMLERWMHVELGDRITVSNLPPQHPTDTVDVLAQGYSEGISPYRWDVEVNASPGAPWQVAEVDSPNATETTPNRADTLASVFSTAMTASQTSVVVSTLRGPAWTTDPAQMPFLVRARGEVMRVTGVATLADTFTRTVANAWGTSSSGNVWTATGGAASDYAVDGARGLLRLTGVNVARVMLMAGVSAPVNLSATFATDKVATGDWITAGLLVRYLDANNFYLAQIDFKHTGPSIGVTLYKVAAGVPTSLGGAEIVGTYSAGERFGLRVKANGSQLSAKLWRAAGPEPARWNLHATDAALPNAGRVGVRGLLTGGNTNTAPVTISVDDLVADQAQQFTVQRGINNTAIAHPAGTSVGLAHPAYLAL